MQARTSVIIGVNTQLLMLSPWSPLGDPKKDFGQADMRKLPLFDAQTSFL
jgi:hypothetical protein